MKMVDAVAGAMIGQMIGQSRWFKEDCSVNTTGYSLSDLAKALQSQDRPNDRPKFTSSYNFYSFYIVLR